MPDGRMLFQLWAPLSSRVQLHLNGTDLEMARCGAGWHELVASARPGDTYGFRLPEGRVVPDPASRCQKSNIDSLSVVTDPEAYAWKTSDWRGRPWSDVVFYEVHIGTFTPGGTFRTAITRLRKLADIGITAIEVMPVAQFAGTRGWGYDGVLQFAPHTSYGTPEDFKAFVDNAHELGLMVFLDVVYNHFGPVGNHLLSYAPEFFHKQSTPWGAAMNFEQSAVRRYFVENAEYWLSEFHLDGLRLDAVDQMNDGSEVHILEELSEAVRTSIAGPRRYLITENPANSMDLLDSSLGPLFDADWNDDFHHAMHVAATGEAAGHYEPFAEQPWQRVNAALAKGYVLPGRALLGSQGSDPTLPPVAFIHYLQNHDQTGNRALGERLVSLINEEAYTLWLEILLLSPQIPLLFQGDDYRESAPFHFFVDTDEERAEAIRNGRAKAADSFGGLPPGRSVDDIPDATDPETFLKSKLPADTAGGCLNEYQRGLKKLLELRRQAISPLLKGIQAGDVVFEREGVIAVDWPCPAGVLQLRANFARHTVELPLRRGQALYARHLLNGDRCTALLGPDGIALVRATDPVIVG
jgi:malto-oligosyltrehalose trehalohydrolase